eukprot:gene7276-8665_t
MLFDYYRSMELRLDMDVQKMQMFKFLMGSSKMHNDVKLPRSMQILVAKHQYKNVIDANMGSKGILNGCDEIFLHNLLLNFSDIFLMPGERYLRANDVPLHLVFLAAGVVEAADSGHSAIVQILLEEGASINALDRWGNTPMKTALDKGFRQCVEVLRSAGGKVISKDPAGELCDAASSDNLDLMKLLIENGVDPSAADYDLRSALHLASAEGHVKAVEYLLNVGVDPNITDRWGGRPLLDALTNNQVAVIQLLQRHKATLPSEERFAKLLEFAAIGNTKGLQALAECGVDFDQANYDGRCALHLLVGVYKCTGALYSILSVGYMETANPDSRDRWNTTPLFDALSHENSLRHTHTGKLIHSSGGEHPPFTAE